MFFDVKFSILKRKDSDYLNLLENSVFQSSVSDFHFVILGWLNMFCKYEWVVSHDLFFLLILGWDRREGGGVSKLAKSNAIQIYIRRALGIVHAKAYDLLMLCVWFGTREIFFFHVKNRLLGKYILSHSLSRQKSLIKEQSLTHRSTLFTGLSTVKEKNVGEMKLLTEKFVQHMVKTLTEMKARHMRELLTFAKLTPQRKTTKLNRKMTSSATLSTKDVDDISTP